MLTSDVAISLAGMTAVGRYHEPWATRCPDPAARTATLYRILLHRDVFVSVDLDRYCLPLRRNLDALRLPADYAQLAALHGALRPECERQRPARLPRSYRHGAGQFGHPATPLAQRATALLGRQTEAARRLGLCFEIVLEALPPLPAGFRSRAAEVPGAWQVIRLWRLDIHDLAATKLKCFRRPDRADLQFLCDLGHLKPQKLCAALESAFLWSMANGGDPERDRAFANLERVIMYLEAKGRTL